MTSGPPLSRSEHTSSAAAAAHQTAASDDSRLNVLDQMRGPAQDSRVAFHCGYYQHFSLPLLDTSYRQLTFNNDVLTSLLVPLTAATNFVGQSIALVMEGLAALTTRDTLPQLALDKQRSAPNRRSKKNSPTHVTKIFHPTHVAGVIAQAPLSNTCSTHPTA